MTAAEVILFREKSAIEIHNEATAAAGDVKQKYLALFEVLLVVEARQIYYEFDITDLKIYCMELLQLSRDVTNDLLIVVRKSLEVPQLAQAVRDGVSIYKARKICSVITQENHRDWIQLAIHCSCRDVERTVAMANPKAAVGESMKYVSGEALEFKLGVGEEWAELLKRTKDLLSQKHKRNITSEEALFMLMSEYCLKNDRVEKAKRAEKKRDSGAKRASKTGEPTESDSTKSAEPVLVAETNPAAVITQSNGESSGRSRYRPAEVDHVVTLRDQEQCAHIDANGNRCEKRRWLARHHIVEFAKGGEHTPENLITLCWGHHKIVHMKAERASVT